MLHDAGISVAQRAFPRSRRARKLRQSREPGPPLRIGRVEFLNQGESLVAGRAGGGLRTQHEHLNGSLRQHRLESPPGAQEFPVRAGGNADVINSLVFGQPEFDRNGPRPADNDGVLLRVQFLAASPRAQRDTDDDFAAWLRGQPVRLQNALEDVARCVDERGIR